MNETHPPVETSEAADYQEPGLWLEKLAVLKTFENTVRERMRFVAERLREAKETWGNIGLQQALVGQQHINAGPQVAKRSIEHARPSFIHKAIIQRHRSG